MEKEVIEEKALKVMSDVDYLDNADAIDVIKIAKALGFAIGNASLVDDVDGFIIIEMVLNRFWG